MGRSGLSLGVMGEVGATDQRALHYSCSARSQLLLLLLLRFSSSGSRAFSEYGATTEEGRHLRICIVWSLHELLLYWGLSLWLAVPGAQWLVLRA